MGKRSGCGGEFENAGEREDQESEEHNEQSCDCVEVSHRHGVGSIGSSTPER